MALALFVMGGMMVIIQQYAITSDPSQLFFVRFSFILAGFRFGWGSGIICASMQEILASLNLYEAGFVVFGAAENLAFVALIAIYVLSLAMNAHRAQTR